ncbi:hypothetical protein D3C76_1366210 [compost metagenome]
MPVIDLGLLKMVRQLKHQRVKGIAHPLNREELMIATAFEAMGCCGEQTMNAIVNTFKIQDTCV